MTVSKHCDCPDSSLALQSQRVGADRRHNARAEDPQKDQSNVRPD